MGYAILDWIHIRASQVSTSPIMQLSSNLRKEWTKCSIQYPQSPLIQAVEHAPGSLTRRRNYSWPCT